MGPIRYLTLRRMHLVRRALQQSHSSTATVTQIVNDHGFWELGRFSVAYRTLFGELPSETFRQSSSEFSRGLSSPRGWLTKMTPLAQRLDLSGVAHVGKNSAPGAQQPQTAHLKA